MMETIRDLFKYDGWANARVFDSLKAAPGGSRKAVRLLAHLLVSEKVWLLRLRGVDTSGINLSPEMSLAECEALAGEMQREYAEHLGSLGEEDLNQKVAYRNSKGKEFQTSLGDILTHVALHGAYHRGQIAAAVRGEGAAPVSTDFINYVREMRG